MGRAASISYRFGVLAALFTLVAGQEKNVTNLGKPISISPSQFWDGRDGPWSTFRIQVGSPPQQIHVLPASDQSSTWLVIPEACGGKGENCAKNRGNTYERNTSSTWDEYGSYELNTFLQGRLGMTGAAVYGYDTIELGWTGDNMPVLPSQVVAGLIAEDFYLGSLAVNPRPMNFTDYNNPIPSLMQTLRTNVTTPIPSTSWSYTAGSFNLSPKVFASLVLGGHDTTRFEPNNVTFPFGADISLDFQVAIQSITADGADEPLLTAGIISYINTLVADIWLPNATCKLFEDAFGLTWDEKTQLYMLNDSLHSSLLERNPVVSFKVGPEITGPSVTIDMPYWAFYHTATPDYLGNNSGLYFPLRRAANDTQYILGRTFLQSAYLSADYDRNMFKLSQALYPASSVAQNLVAIFPPANESPLSDPKKEDSSTGLSTGVIAGIAVAAVVIVAIVAAIFFIIYRRKKAKKDKKGAELADTDVLHNKAHEVDGDDRKYEVGDGLRHEVPGDSEQKVELYAGGGHEKPVEADGNMVGIYEMPAEEIKYPELEGEGHMNEKNLASSQSVPVAEEAATIREEGRMSYTPGDDQGGK
jgi:hypothetical protein